MCLHVTIPPNLTSFLLFLEIKDLQHPSALLSGQIYRYATIVNYIECVVSIASRKDGGGKSRTFGWSTGLAEGVVGARELVLGVKGVAKVVGVKEVMWLKELMLVLGGAT